MPAQRRHARLKDSCDHCSNAKVRCTKEKPSCSRCHQRDLPCEYSYSRRAGRRNTSRVEVVEMPSPVDRCSSPSVSSSFSDWDETPSSSGSMGGVMGSPLSFIAAPSFSWEQGLFQAQRNFLEQSAEEPPVALHLKSTLADPSMPTLNSGFAMPPQPIQAHTMVRNPSTASTGSMSSEYYAFSDYSNSSIHSQTEAVQDELSNLSNFAEAMERKFDAVVRSRLQSRDIFSEFGTPWCDLEIEDGSIPTPDTSELAFYYSLAELRRRLKWVSEDVGNMISNPT